METNVEEFLKELIEFLAEQRASNAETASSFVIDNLRVSIHDYIDNFARKMFYDAVALEDKCIIDKLNWLIKKYNLENSRDKNLDYNEEVKT